MSWYPVDDLLHGDPRARRAGLEAMGLWTLAGSHCMGYLTDGFVAEWFVKEKPKGASLAKRLVDAGFWTPSEKDGERGWQFLEWKPECTKVVILENREKNRLRKAKSRESRRESRVTDDETGHGATTGRDAGVLGYIQPNPTQPINPVETLGGEGPAGNARDTTPRPQCHDHPDGNASTPCGACQARREWDKDHAEALAADEVARRRADRAAATEALANCRHCRGSGWLLDDDGTPVDPAIRCTHQPQAAAR